MGPSITAPTYVVLAHAYSRNSPSLEAALRTRQCVALANYAPCGVSGLGLPDLFLGKPADLHITTTTCSSMVTQDEKLDQMPGQIRCWTKDGNWDLSLQQRASPVSCTPGLELGCPAQAGHSVPELRK